IVPVPTVSATAPRIQLDEINPLEKMSFGFVRPGRPYELHILVQPGKFRPGISPELEIDSVEGGAIGATYHSGRLLFQDDRWELGGRVAAAARRPLFSVAPASGSMFSSPYACAHTRQYAEMALELTLDPDSIRRDRHHLLGLDARVYGPPHEGQESALHLAGWYQKMFSFGWN